MHRRITPRVALAAALVLAACAPSAPDHGPAAGRSEAPLPPARATPPEASADNAYARMLAAVNGYRRAHGLSPVRPDRRLDAAAAAVGRAMVERRTVDHHADGRDLEARLDAAGYPFASAAENLSAGRPGAEATVDAWMASQGHRSNLLLAGARDAGIAHLRPSLAQGDVGWRDYWVLVLARPLERRSRAEASR